MEIMKRILAGVVVAVLAGVPSYADENTSTVQMTEVLANSQSQDTIQLQNTNKEMSVKQPSMPATKKTEKHAIRNVVLISVAAVTVVGLAIFFLWWTPGGSIK